MARLPFWQTKSLAEMTEAEWESICDGCGKCCLVKLQDEESGDIAFTDLSCKLLDTQSCRCRHYEQRLELVPECVKLTKDNLAQIDFMPPSCAYRLLHDGKALPHWHPLVSGQADSTVRTGRSVAGRVLSETDFSGDWETRIVDWPNEENIED